MTNGEPGRLRGLLPLAGVLLIALVPYRTFFTSRVPVGRDLPFYFYPLKAHLAEALRSGEVPWIDRYRWGGTPLLGAPGAAAFHPANVLFLLLPLGAAVKCWTLLHLAVAITGFAALSRRLGLSREAAAVAGLVFGLGGASVSVAAFLPTASALAVLPWFAAFLLDIRAGRGPIAVVKLALATALLVAACIPELWLHAAVVALVTLTGRGPAGLVTVERRRWHHALGAVAAGGLLGLGLGAPAFLPAAVTAAESTRGPGGGTSLEFASQGALPAARLKEILSDGLTADWTTAATHPDVPAYPYLPSVTPGRVALALALAGTLAGGAGRLHAAFLSGAGIVLALGPATPVWTLVVRSFPPLLSLRYPEKHLILAGFGLAWLAALGVGALELRLSPAARRLVLPLLALAVLLDRERTARGLSPTGPATVLTEAPEVLRGLPARGPGDVPPRLFHRDSYAPVPAFDLRDLAASNRTARASLLPEYGTLFGIAYQFELDYDLSLPREAFEWTRLLTRAVPLPNPLPDQITKAAGITAVVRSERSASGAFVPRLVPVSRPLPPFRFVGRVRHDPDGRRLFQSLLEEGFDPDTAYIQDPAPGAAGEERPVRGRVLEVSDRPDALRLAVDVPPGGEGFLAVYRLASAAREARLDGRPVEVAEMAFGFTGIRVSTGRHSVELRPETRWVKIGAAVSAVAAVLLVLVARGRRDRGCPGP